MFIKRTFLSFALLAHALLWAEYSIAQPSSKGVSTATALARAALPRGSARDFGPAPAVPKGALSQEVQAVVEKIFIEGVDTGWGAEQDQALEVIQNSKDPRLAWIVTDLLRFSQGPIANQQLRATLMQLLNFSSGNVSVWNDATNRLMAWDIPEPPGYLKYKRNIFTTVLPEWKPIFVEGDIDWRFVSWGGVLIDDREFDKTDELCNCIPAADNPPVTDAKSCLLYTSDAADE